MRNEDGVGGSVSHGGNGAATGAREAAADAPQAAPANGRADGGGGSGVGRDGDGDGSFSGRSTGGGSVGSDGDGEGSGGSVGGDGDGDGSGGDGSGGSDNDSTSASGGPSRNRDGATGRADGDDARSPDGSGDLAPGTRRRPAALRTAHRTLHALREPALLVVDTESRCVGNDAFVALLAPTRRAELAELAELAGHAGRAELPLPPAGADLRRHVASLLARPDRLERVDRVRVDDDEDRQLGELLLPRLAVDASADYHQAAELSPEVPWIAAADGRVVEFNRRWSELTGMTAGDAIGDGWRRAVHPEDLDATERAWRRAVETGEALDVEHRLGAGDGTWHWMRARARPQRDADGRIVRWYGVTEDIDERRRAQSLLGGQKEALELAAHGAPMAEVLQRLARAACDPFAGGAAAALLLAEPAGRELRLAASWGLPAGYAAASAVVSIGPDAPACGRAAYSGQAVFVDDVAALADDPDGWRTLALAHGIRACWSKPVTTLGGEVVGTLAVYPPTPRLPSDAEREALRLLTRCAAIVIEREREAAERARTERLLAESEQRLRTVFAAIDEGYALCEIVVDDDGRPQDYRFLEVNPQFEAMTGLANAAGHRAYRSVPDLEPHWLEAYARVGLGGETLRFEERSDAMDRWFEVFATPVEPQGRFVLVFRDVSARRSAEAALQASESRFRTMADGVAAMIWVTDAAGGVEFVNRTFGAFFGVDPAALRDRGWQMLVHPEDHDGYVAAFEAALREAAPFHARARVRHASGGWHWIDSIGSPRLDDAGRFVGHVGVSYDITELLTTQLALREADQRKDRFIATLSHELRNPLAPIRNAAELLAAPAIGDERRIWAGEVVKRQVAHVAALLDDLLDLARINAGKLSLKRSRTTLGAVVDAAVEAARPLIDAGRHRLALGVDRREATLFVDEVRVVQVLTNLLTNAAKYTDPDGLIALDAGVVDAELVVSVRDDGIGMDRDALASVFGMFSQVQGERDRAQGGLGIGLALVKGLVELHGGGIAAASAGRGRGSEFVVRIPLPAGETAPADAPAPAADGAALRVLVVDDHVDAAETLAMLLGLSGHAVRVAHDAESALAEAEAFRPQVALLDIGLPGADGHELARRLRARSWGGAVRLVALTGWGQPGDRRRAAEAGFDEHLVKPVDPERLDAALRGPTRS